MQAIGRRARSWWEIGGTLIAVLACAVFLAACGDDDSKDEGSNADKSGGEKIESVRVGVIEIAQVQIFEDIFKGFHQGLAEELGIPEDKVELDIQNAQGDPGLIETLARSMPREDYDLFAVIGTPAVIALADQEKERAIIATNMTYPVEDGVAESLERPGGNVTGSSDGIAAEDIVTFLQQVSPSPKRIGTVYDPSNTSTSRFAKDLKEALEADGRTLVEAPVSTPGDATPAARSLVGKVDAILLPGDAISAGPGLPTIAATALRAKIPLFMGAGVSVDEAPGIAAVLAPDNIELGRLAGEVAGKALKSGKPGEVPFATVKPQVTINPEVAEQLGIEIPESPFG